MARPSTGSSLRKKVLSKKHRGEAAIVMKRRINSMSHLNKSEKRGLKKLQAELESEKLRYLKMRSSIVTKKAPLGTNSYDLRPILVKNDNCYHLRRKAEVYFKGIQRDKEELQKMLMKKEKLEKILAEEKRRIEKLSKANNKIHMHVYGMQVGGG
jgi:hypothetical protein